MMWDEGKYQRELRDARLKREGLAADTREAEVERATERAALQLVTEIASSRLTMMSRAKIRVTCQEFLRKHGRTW